ncbi:MAG: hypothetical protein IJT48_07070 [Bacteroidaceae bacterium]|nr:hypothetical protein [Bacteroidaceae bacterium]
MSLTKEIIEQERQQVQTGRFRDVHLHKEGTFLRAYEWSAWLCCRYLHDFKVNKRQFKGIDDPVAYIGFPETSLPKWTPEGSEQRVEAEKHLVLTLPEAMVTDEPEVLASAFSEWKQALPLAESSQATGKKGGKVPGLIDEEPFGDSPPTLTSIMQRVLAYPIESKSPLESMTFLADIKQRLATLI